jgi:hypothetical protein
MKPARRPAKCQVGDGGSRHAPARTSRGDATATQCERDSGPHLIPARERLPALAIEMGADAADIGLTIHPHPTLSETIAMAAEAFEGTITDLYLPKRR